MERSNQFKTPLKNNNAPKLEKLDHYKPKAFTTKLCLKEQAIDGSSFFYKLNFIIDTECKPRDGNLVIVHYDGTDNATIREIMIDGRTKELRPILSNNPAESVTSEHHILGVLIQTRFS